MALSFDANFLATEVAFAVLLITVFFPGLSLGVGTTPGLVGILFTPMHLVFFLYGRGFGDDSSAAAGSLVVPTNPPFAVVSKTYMAEWQGKDVRLIKSIKY